MHSEGDMALPRQAHQGTTRSGSGFSHADPVVHTTLLELVRTIGEITDDETEIVATVLQMLRSGRVKLAGSFHDEPIRVFFD
jgi:hypothetical protein